MVSSFILGEKKVKKNGREALTYKDKRMDCRGVKYIFSKRGEQEKRRYEYKSQEK